MTRPLRAAACAVVIPVLLSLGGCYVAPLVLAVGGALVAASDLYCAAVAERAKQAVRDRVTGGRPIIHCALEGR